MNIRFWLIVAACVCAFVAMVLGFGLGWLGIGGAEATADYPGWLAVSLLLFFAAHVVPPRGGP